MHRLLYNVEGFMMNRVVGICCVALAFTATYVFHVGTVSFVLAEGVGNLLGLPDDRSIRLVVSIPAFGLGFVLMTSVLLGMFFRHRIAFLLAAIVFLAAIPVAIWFQFVAVDYTPWSRLRDAAQAALCVACAAYTWRLSLRHSAPRARGCT
jgi:hypothetical protein